VRGSLLRYPLVVAGFATVAAANVWLGGALTTSPRLGVALVLLPVLAVALGALIASNRATLVYLAIAFQLFAPLPLNDPLPGGIYPSDLLVALAVGSWVTAWLVNPPDKRPSWVKTPVLGLPLLVFAAALSMATVRGEADRGLPLLGPSFRLVVYAAIVFAMTDLRPRDAYNGLVALFYAGTVWQVLVAFYSLATGTSATDQVFLSTGGERLLAGSTSIFMAGALLLALLNLERDRHAGRSALHLTIAALATLALFYTFARITYAAVALLVPVALFAYRRVGSRVLAYLPLCVPFLVLAALLIPRVDPDFYPTLRERIATTPSADSSAEFRRELSSAVWEQVRENPLLGVGFGRESVVRVENQPVTIVQDPHNQFLFLWAGGGLVLLGSFIVLLVVYLFDARRRFRAGTPDERRLVFWAVALWFVFVVNSAAGIILTSPSLLLVFWILMLLPTVVRPEERRDLGQA
jgi:O-Antigen ligase